MKQIADRIALLILAIAFITLFSPFSPAIVGSIIDRFFPERLLPTTGLVESESDRA